MTILFVCLGNICRSPLAEGIMKHLTRGRRDFHIASAGTGAWHVGELPDSRMRDTAQKHGIKLVSRAQQVTPELASAYDLVLAMDLANLRNLRRMGIPCMLLRDFDPEAMNDAEVPDPYYGGQRGFEEVFEIVERCCIELLRVIDRGEL